MEARQEQEAANEMRAVANNGGRRHKQVRAFCLVHHVVTPLARARMPLPFMLPLRQTHPFHTTARTAPTSSCTPPRAPCS